MSLNEWLHEWYGFDRRVRALSRQIETLLPHDTSVLDVGCGDGTIDRLIQEKRPDLEFRGIDILVRSDTKIPVTEFDGVVIPHPDDSFDCVIFVDVLHHSDNANQLLCEARRVARRFVIIKDHILSGYLAGPTLRFMDDVGNKRHGVRLPYNYWKEDEWRSAFVESNLSVEVWNQGLGIYPWPATLLFDRDLHFLTQLGTQPAG